VPRIELQFEAHPPFVLVTPAVVHMPVAAHGDVVGPARLVPGGIVSGFQTQTSLQVYVRILPKCLSGSVGECRAFLKVFRQVKGDWLPTALSESRSLIWSNKGTAPIELYKGVDQFLDIFYVDEEQNHIVPCVDPLPLVATRTFEDV
jgi:hypothetical protein